VTKINEAILGMTSRRRWGGENGGGHILRKSLQERGDGGQTSLAAPGSFGEYGGERSSKVAEKMKHHFLCSH